MKVRLELDFIEILRKRKRWNLYMILATDDPTDKDKTLISVIPNEPIKLRKMDNNRIDFEADGDGDTNGLILFERLIPKHKSVRARIWIVQSRETTRNTGEVLRKITNVFKKDKVNSTIENLTSALGVANPWLKLPETLLSINGLIGSVLKELKDRKLGFVNMDESFTDEEINMFELDRTGKITSVGKCGWSWSIK
jgi:hypothetical protein